MTNINPFELSSCKPNHFGFGGLNRNIEFREQSDWLEILYKRNNTKFVPLWKSQNLFLHSDDIKNKAPIPAFPEISEFKDISDCGENHTLLGFKNINNEEIGYIGVDLSALDYEEVDRKVCSWGSFQDLREIGPLIDSYDGSILSYARGIIIWNSKNRFCCFCGSQTISSKSGHQRDCENFNCNTKHFPRTDPAVIMLIHDGNRTLLGRQEIWPEGMYSTLAGFVEPGETLENAVAREVFEESGIEVKNVSYHSSQPWPFPSSLMLGFYAEAKSFDININKSEIEDVQWFTRGELKNFSNQNKYLPRELSISRRLIEDWINWK